MNFLDAMSAAKNPQSREDDRIAKLAQDIKTKDERVVISVDSQVTTEIKKCAQSTHNKFGLNIRLADRREDSLWWGILIHEMLRSHYSDVMSNIKGETNYSYPDIIERAITAGNLYAVNSPGVIRYLSGGDLDNAVNTYQQYASIYQYEGLEPMAVEQSFSKILYEDNAVVILMNGIIDLLVKRSGLARPHPYDHKTFSSWYDVNPLENQFFTYAWGLDVPYLTVNRIGRKPTRNPPDRFQRIALSFTSEKVEEWANEMVIWILNYYNQTQAGIFMKNDGSCDKFGGCQFKQLCVANPEDRLYIIQTDYEVVPEWDPLDRDHSR